MEVPYRSEDDHELLEIVLGKMLIKYGRARTGVVIKETLDKVLCKITRIGV